MMTTWIDQTDGTRWTGVARFASINCEVVLEQADRNEGKAFRIMRDFGGESARIQEGNLKVSTWIGAIFAAVATVQRDIDAIGGEDALQSIASPGRPGEPK